MKTASLLYSQMHMKKTILAVVKPTPVEDDNAESNEDDKLMASPKADTS